MKRYKYKIIVCSIIIFLFFIINENKYTNSGYSYDNPRYGYTNYQDTSTYDKEQQSEIYLYILVFSVLTICFIIQSIRSYNYTKEQRDKLDNKFNELDEQTKHEDERENKVIQVIKISNKEFVGNEFKKWAHNLFLDVEVALSKQDITPIKEYETYALAKVQTDKINEDKALNHIDIAEIVCIEYLSLYRFDQIDKQDVLKVKLSARLISYILDSRTNRPIEQYEKDNEEYQKDFILTFIKNTDENINPELLHTNINNCPNCGAPLIIDSFGKCEYCGSNIVKNKYKWLLSNIESLDKKEN